MHTCVIMLTCTTSHQRHLDMRPHVSAIHLVGHTQCPSILCSSVLTLRYSEYEEPQSLENQHVDTLLEEEFKRRHLATHNRPALEDCIEEEFETDLCEFLRQRQEPSLAKAVAEHRITW